MKSKIITGAIVLWLIIAVVSCTFLSLDIISEDTAIYSMAAGFLVISIPTAILSLITD